MGLYFQPGNRAFKRILSSTNYVDRTGVISELNRRIGTPDNLICLSLSRRSGKTWQFETYCSYYDYSCDSGELFDGLAISNDPSYREHMNRYIVIRLDMAVMMSNAPSPASIRAYVEGELKREALRLYKELGLDEADDINTLLSQIVSGTGRQLIFFIDEWDAPIRMATHDQAVQAAYLDMLRNWFKNSSFTSNNVAAAYMTGILPIKKLKGESAISDFDEYTVFNPGFFGPYIGFHEDEVRCLCEDSVDFNTLEDWYEGYTAGDWHYYNPYAVIQAIKYKKVKSYWPATTAAETLTDYIKLNYDGLQEAIVALIGDARILVDTTRFQNDTVRFNSRDDVLTLLIHLGYLSYDKISEADVTTESNDELSTTSVDTGLVYARIPNLELKLIFRGLLDENGGMPELIRFMRCSIQLLKDTEALKSDAVAAAFDKLHSTNYAPSLYNNEQSLRSVIRLAYIAYLDEYYKLEEVPSGKGVADIVFVPKQTSVYSPMIVELKWNRSPDVALSQIMSKRYDAIFDNSERELLFVGINYDAISGRHSCRIIRLCQINGEYAIMQDSATGV